MFPLFLDLSALNILLVGNGEKAARRLAQLESFGADKLMVYAPEPQEILARRAGGRLVERLPRPEDIEWAQLVLVADLEKEAALALAVQARAAGKLINVEDDKAHSDFYFPAIVRRGDLTLAVSTNGKSPAAASAIRDYLEDQFTPQWEVWLDAIAAQREHWREQGDDGATITRKTRTLMQRHGMLPFLRDKAA